VTDVLYVVGGGPSGLAAAHRLRSSDWNVVVLDAGARPGGKLQTIHRDGFVMETGAALLSSAYDSVLGLADEVGMRGALVPGASSLGIARGGDIHRIDTNRLVRDGLRTRLLPWRSKLRMARLLLDNRRVRHLLSFDDLSAAGAVDVETALEYCERRLDRDIYDYVVDSCMRGINGTSGAKVSAVEFFFAVNKVLGSSLYSFQNGMTSFVDALTAGLDVRSGCTVTNITERADGVSVEWSDASGARQVVDTPGCILAVPGDLVPGLVPGLPSDISGFLGRLKYTTMVNLNIALASRPPGLTGLCLQIPRPVSEGLFTISVDHDNPAARAPAGKGLVGLYTTSEWAERLILEDDDTVTRHVLAEAERVVPGLTGAVEHVRVNRWSRSLVYSRPGLYRELGEFTTQLPRDGRLHLAGDYFSSSNLNTAATAGERAARDLTHVLSTGVARVGACR